MFNKKIKIPEGDLCYSSSIHCDYIHGGEKHNNKIVCEKYDNVELIAEGGCLIKCDACLKENK